MTRRLTVRQQKFAIALIGAANGNQTRAARMAGYKGNARQLAVQGSVNMKNPAIQQMISEMLFPLVKPSVQTLADGLDATKRRAFRSADGGIVYTDPEPDHNVRTKTANQILDRYERVNRDSEASDADAADVHDEGAEQVATDGTKPNGDGDSGNDGIAHLDPADRALFRQAAALEAELAELDRQLDDVHGGDGTAHDGHGRAR